MSEWAEFARNRDRIRSMAMTQRGDQITAIGREQGKFQEGDLMELCFDALLNMGTSLPVYRADVGPRVQRYLKIIESNEEEGYIDVEMRFTGWREPDKRFRVRLVITEQQC